QNRPRIESGRQAGLDYPQPRTVVIGSGEWLKRWLASCDALTTADIRRGNSGFTEQFQIGDGGNRTHDLRIKSPMLYRLSYVSVVVIISINAHRGPPASVRRRGRPCSRCRRR